MSPSKGIEELTKGLGETLPKIGKTVLLTSKFGNSSSLYLFLKFESQLGKSEKFNNPDMQENKKTIKK